MLFLFVIGLEFRPDRLWRMRKAIFGRGATQVALAALLLCIPAFLYGYDWKVALVVGLGLALSSTALVMQSLEETGQRSGEHGRTSVSILIFEDLAIVPMLLLVAFLSPSDSANGSTIGSLTSLGSGIAMIGVLVAAGRYLLNPIFAILARTGVQEVMTAGALGVVIAAALMMDMVGLSYAMGSFIAGVMLAGSRFRHEVEADVEPFRGLFLGLFFVAVGLSLDLAVVAANWQLIAVAVPLLLSLKIVAVYFAGRLFAVGHKASSKTALTLSQHGEFGFVLFSAAAASSLIDPRTASILVSVITLSMAVSSIANKMIALPRTEPDADPDPVEADDHVDVLLVGFGRFGQIVAKPLLDAGLSLSIIDRNADRVTQARAFCSTLQFGDGTRRDVLNAAGAARAGIIVIAVDEAKDTEVIAAMIGRDFPHARLFCRTYDRRTAILLREAEGVVRETAAAAFELGQMVLEAADVTEEEARDLVEETRERDRTRLLQQMSEAGMRRNDISFAETVRPRSQ